MRSNKQGSHVFSNANDDMKNLTPESPYYINPNETWESFKPSLILSGSDNYPKWYRAMVRGFTLRKKLDFADGKIAVPSNDHLVYDAWKKNNELVLFWILKAVSPEIAKSVQEMSNAVDVWRNLKELFSPGDQFMISDILEEIYSLRQGERDVGRMSSVILMSLVYCGMRTGTSLPSTCVHLCGDKVLLRCYAESEGAERARKSGEGSSRVSIDDQRFVATRSRKMREDPLPPIGEVYFSVPHLEDTPGQDLKQLHSQPPSTS